MQTIPVIVLICCLRERELAGLSLCSAHLIPAFDARPRPWTRA